MRSLFRYFLINLAALWITTEVIAGFTYQGGIKTLLIGTLVFAMINFLLVPLLKIMLLPLNLLTLGIFAWVTNVLALYALTSLLPAFKLTPFHFSGYNYQGFIVPSADFSTLWVAILASAMIGLLTHFMHWLVH